MITRTPWFGPKTGVGWGWTPITWQGWVVTVVVVAAIAMVATLPGVRYRIGIVTGLAIGLIVVCMLTGTRPGGRS